MSRPNLSGKPTKTVACEISEKDHMKIKTLAQLSGKTVRDLAAELLCEHDLDARLKAAMSSTFGDK